MSPVILGRQIETSLVSLGRTLEAGSLWTLQVW
jgi:hypothetical protein